MALHTQLPAYVPTPYIFLLPVPHRILSCSENLVVATGKGLIKAVALSDTFLPQEPPPRKHIVGAMPAVHCCCGWLANEGNVAVRGNIGRLVQPITAQYCGFGLTSPTGMFSMRLQPYRQHSNPN